MKLKIIISTFLFFFIFQANAQEIKKLCNTISDLHSTMCWKNSINEDLPKIFTVETNQYEYEFDYENLDFDNFHIVGGSQTRSPHIEFGIMEYNREVVCKSSSVHVEDCQLIHTGRFLQHRFINWIPQLSGFDPYTSGLEIISWNDRLTLSVRVKPIVVPRVHSMFLRFDVPSEYKFIETVDRKDWYVYKSISGNDGYLISRIDDETEISVEGNHITAKISVKGRFKMNKTYETGIIVYPVNDVFNEIKKVIANEETQLSVSAIQVFPENAEIECVYDRKMGWYKLGLRNDFIKGKREDLHNRIERVKLVIENKNSEKVTARLNFAKDNDVYAIEGISAMIRDKDGYPTGLPVQLVKNWHNGDNNELYRGPWYHGLTTLLIPANGKVELEYTAANAFWGGVPAASHAQLCLVGWGSNQLWEEAAIGAWGENICYEPDMLQAQAAVLDVRPLNLISPQGNKWGWTSNVGGADILHIKDSNGKRVWHTGVKMQAERNCPNLTAVTYSGTLFEGKANFTYTASIGRSDDMTRGIYKIGMNVIDDVEFSEFDVFQLGASTYHYASSGEIAVGNECGLINKWDANNNKKQSPFEPSGELKGGIPWVSMYESSIDFFGTFGASNQMSYYPADRGFVLRKWESKLNGKTTVTPLWKERTALIDHHGTPCSIMTITLPDYCKSLSKGDYIEAEVEMFIVPMKEEHYYGANTAFRKALKSSVKSPWKMAYREAKGNNLSVVVRKGKLLSSYPVVISSHNNEAIFQITGGIGYVPLSVKGLTDYKRPSLYVKDHDKWTLIDQSVHGNDFWQIDFHSNDKTWEITYNLDLDKYINREYKFLLD